MLRLLLVATVMVSAVAGSTSISISYHIEKTWNGGEIDHPPIKFTLQGHGQNELLFLVEAPFFNDPPNPGGKPGQPFLGLWNYEVVEIFFLNDDNQYVEIELSPHGQHIVLLFKAQSETIRHSLPLKVKTTIHGDKWTGSARIPISYLPPKVTKFNAYGIHGSDPNRVYEALYTALATDPAPNFHALQYFSDIDLSQLIPPGSNDEMSELWQDALNGLFRYRVEATWNGRPIDHDPVMITLQGFQDGIEMNVTGPSFNESHVPRGRTGPVERLWEYEAVEMLFANEKNEYLRVSLGPLGHHQVMLVQDSPYTPLKKSLPLDYIVSQDPGKRTWKGSALIPPSFFPPHVNRMNAYVSHGSGSKRKHESLYPVSSHSTLNERLNLEYFVAIDFEFLEPKNPKSDYSSVWGEAIQSRAGTTTTEQPQPLKSEEGPMIPPEDIMTVLGPSTTLKPDRQHLLRRLDESVNNKQQQIGASAPDRNQGHVHVKHQQEGKVHPLRRKQDPPVEQDPVYKKEEPPQAPVFMTEDLPEEVDVVTTEDPLERVTVITTDDPLERVAVITTEDPLEKVSVFVKEDPPQAPVVVKEEPPQVPLLTKEEPLEDPLDVPLQDPLYETEGPFLEEDPLQDLIPSIDFVENKPILPAPHPFCIEEGLVKDYIRCQVFHECVVENNEWRVYHWRCPRGHYFDQEKIACITGYAC
ncbi:uncharacterized protein LOC143038676 [Oratosquilla oratoria]|uniref:uncharacterized protein LOC143038676 n=1 Tax=Oratosquilla oratoria TaxID=337810 RepID=UPI003F7637AA